MRNLLLALMLVGTHSVLSQETPADKRKDLATLEGRAIISTTGEPVSGVRPRLARTAPGTDTVKVASDADGRFSFEEMDPGSYILSASRSGGFLAEVYGAGSPGSSGTPLTLSAGQVLTNIEFRLTPLGVISGTVVDDRGNPMPGVRVTATGAASMANRIVSPTIPARFAFRAWPRAATLSWRFPRRSRRRRGRHRRTGRTRRAPCRNLLPLGNRSGGGYPTGGCARSGTTGNRDRRSESAPLPRPGQGSDLVGGYIARGCKSLR